MTEEGAGGGAQDADFVHDVSVIGAGRISLTAFERKQARGIYRARHNRRQRPSGMALL
jgi:hypothetical protein